MAINKKDVPTPDEPKVGKTNKTRHLRAPIEIRIEVTQGMQSFTATSRNLALGGVSFESLNELAVGEKVNILLYIPIKKELELLKAASEIVWVEDQQGSWMMGAAFRKFAPGDQKRLREWLLECVLAQKEGRSIL
ncbi:MAG: PilZ domain-containing protein [Myxococcaceae bacterium]